MTHRSLRKGGVDMSRVVDVIFGSEIQVRLENGKTVFLDFKHDGGRGANIIEDDKAAIDYFPKSASAVVNTVTFTVKRDGKEIFRDNIPLSRVIG